MNFFFFLSFTKTGIVCKRFSHTVKDMYLWAMKMRWSSLRKVQESNMILVKFPQRSTFKTLLRNNINLVESWSFMDQAKNLGWNLNFVVNKVKSKVLYNVGSALAIRKDLQTPETFITTSNIDMKEKIWNRTLLGRFSHLLASDDDENSASIDDDWPCLMMQTNNCLIKWFNENYEKQGTNL